MNLFNDGSSYKLPSFCYELDKSSRRVYNL